MSKEDGVFDNELRGVLFKNDRRREGKKDPHYTGSCEVGGMEYWMAGWKKKSKDGDVYVSLSFSVKDKESRKGKATDENVDDLPF